MPGVEVYVTEDCIGCGACTEGICFVDAIELIDDRAVINDQCRGCGRCVEICPQNAIKIEIKDKDFIIKSIERLDKIIDVT
jgi:MinD superfamily P-loop ATPase